MALALVLSLEQSGGRILLEVDTGTNPLYRVLLGREVRYDEVFTVVDDVFWQSPWARNRGAGRHLDTRVQVAIPASVAEPRCLVQVVTAKDGPRAAAYSAPRRVLVAPALEAPGLSDDGGGLLAMTSSLSPSRPAPTAHALPAMTEVRTAREVFSRPAALDDLLGSLVQAALPVVQQLLSGDGSGTRIGGAAATPNSDNDQLAATIAAVLQAVLGASRDGAMVQAQSLEGRAAGGRNRFREDLAAPMIVGVDDALLASLAGSILSSIAGPLLDKLPELLNAANQHRMDARNADYQLVNQIMASLDRQRLADRLATLAAVQPPPQDSAQSPDLAALLEILRTATAPAAGATQASTTQSADQPPTTSSTEPAAQPQSLRSRAFALSGEPKQPAASRAQLTPVTAAPVPWLGQSRIVFVRDRALGLRWRLDVGASGPATSLPRAILRVAVRRPGGAQDLLQREERLTDVPPGTEFGIQLDPAGVQQLPADTELEVFAQLRWPTSAGTRQCTSSQTIVLTTGRYVVSAGAPAGERVELTDMTRFRPFWNKIWSSPPSTSERPLWGIDVTLRYSVVVTDATANGLMEVRTLAGTPSAGLRATTTGRMRSGLQVCIHELAKLRTLWPDAPPLDDATVAAFAAVDWRAGQGGDAEVAVRFDGRRHTRGLVWAVPVPALRTFEVAQPQDLDPRGQVLAVTTTQVAFPVVEAVRVLGLVSTGSSAADAPSRGDDVEEAASAGVGGSAYAFQGYQVVLDTLVGLEPTRPVPAAPLAASAPMLAATGSLR